MFIIIPQFRNLRLEATQSLLKIGSCVTFTLNSSSCLPQEHLLFKIKTLSFQTSLVVDAYRSHQAHKSVLLHNVVIFNKCDSLIL
jgi:hypothetical protein